MRVTRQALINSFLQNLNSTSSNLQKINSQISSGKRVQRPEDDSVAASAIVRLQAQINETKQYQENIMQSLSELNSIDSTLGEISSILMRSRELGVQASNDTMSPAERDAIAVEVNQLLESLVQVANTTMGGKFLFAGHNSSNVTFEGVRGAEIGEVKDIVTIDGEIRKDINANNITQVRYIGDSGNNSIQVDQSLLVRNNITGQELFFFDEIVSNDSAKLFEKQAGINLSSRLESIVNGLGKTGVSAGYLFVKNTGALQLSPNTDPDGDNSTKLSLLNNGRGVGIDEYGVSSPGTVEIKDSNGAATTFTYADIAAYNTTQEMVDFLNSKTKHPTLNPAGPDVSFIIAENAIKMIDNAKGGGISAVTDSGGSFIGRDLGLTQTPKLDFPAIRFDKTTPLNAWLKSDLPNMAGSKILVQDATGAENVIDVSTLNNNSTVGDFIDLFNDQSSAVSVRLSPDGFGLEYLDQTEGTANMHIKNFSTAGAFNIIDALNIGTPENGAQKKYNASGSVLVDLTGIGDTILTFDEMLKSINEQITHIGVRASIDPASNSLIFSDNRASSQLGEFPVAVNNAIGFDTPIEALNEGGGINHYKIQISDSNGVSQVIDFHEAKTVEDIINAINTYMEPVTEKTTLKEIEGLIFAPGLGDIEVSSSVGAAVVDFSGLNQNSTVQELLSKINEDISGINASAHIVRDENSSAIRLEFRDMKNESGQGVISIRDLNGGTAAENLGIIAYAEGSPYAGDFIVHKKVDVKASLNDDRSGLKIVDNKGGEAIVTEFEGRTTAYDLGLIAYGDTQSICVDGVIRGSGLKVFHKIADELGISPDTGTAIKRADDTLSGITNYGGINDKIYGVKSSPIYTMSLTTMKGSADLDPRLHGKTRLSALNNSATNMEYSGNNLKNIDLSGTLNIENLHDDGSGNFEKIAINLQHLPSNPTVDDLKKLIDAQIAADDSFHTNIDLKITDDGRIKFLADTPIRFSLETTGSASAKDLFGIDVPTDFQHSLSTLTLGLQKPTTAGTDINNFFISDPVNQGSLEIDLERISFEKYGLKRELELEDIKNYLEFNGRKPAQLSPDTLLLDLGILTPLQIPGTDPSFAAFNSLDISSTLQDFINCVATPGSIFDGNVKLEIADGVSNSTEADKNRKLVLIETSGLTATDTLETLKLPVELNKVFTTLGLKSGGKLSNLPNSTNVGISGAQITGLGYDLKVNIDPQGTIAIKSLDPTRRGRLYVTEGRGTTASDLKILAGSGAIGNGTEAITSGDLNPGADRNSLLSELIPKTSGTATSFEAILQDIYIENGMDAAQIKFLKDPPLNMQTPLKALNGGNIDINTGIYQGGVDAGRPASGFEIEDQFGNKAIVDLSNNLSVSSYKTYPTAPPYPGSNEIGQYLFKPVTDLFASAGGPGVTRLNGSAGNFSEFKTGDFFEIAEDRNIDGIGQAQSSFNKYRITDMAADGSWIEFDTDSSNFDLTPDNPGNNNYTVNVFPGLENMYAKMETEYVNKPFYSPDSNISDLQMALNIAIDKAKRTTGFGVEQIILNTTPESNTLLMHVYGENGPTITINERDIDADGKSDSSTAEDLKLLREVGARGNGSPLVESGHLNVSPTLSYLLDTINSPLSGANVTASIGNNGSGPTIDISSNTNSSYMKIRDTFEGNSASQTGMAATRSLFQTMIDFRDALYRNDTNYISQQTLKHIGKDEEKILEYRAQIGSVVNRFESNMDRLESTKIEQTTRFSEHQDLNLSDAIIELRQLELMQRAALNVGSRIFQQSLLDFLG